MFSKFNAIAGQVDSYNAVTANAIETPTNCTIICGSGLTSRFDVAKTRSETERQETSNWVLLDISEENNEKNIKLLIFNFICFLTFQRERATFLGFISFVQTSFHLWSKQQQKVRSKARKDDSCFDTDNCVFFLLVF
jgi:hypothetical protein